MSGLRIGRTAAVVALLAICLSCGDTFRPVAVPLPPTHPDPGSLHYVLMVNGNGPSNFGGTARIDTSGDTNVGDSKLGLGPVHVAITPNGARTYVANSLNDTISSFASSTPTVVTGISLPTGSLPIAVATTENTEVFEANWGTGTVSVISETLNVVTSTIAVDPTQGIPNPNSQPVALVELPNSTKVYSVNQGINSVSSISVSGKVVSAVIPVGTSPVWAAARSDSARVYVLNQGSGTVSVIDTTTDTAISTVSVGAGANYMFYEPGRNRLYVTNPPANTVIGLDVSVDPPATLFTAPVATNPTSVTALADGSRIYAVSFQRVGPCTTDPLDLRPCVNSQVTVLNALDGSFRSTIPLQSTVNVTSAAQSGSNTTYSYALVSGAIVQAGMTVVISGMADAGNNGSFHVITGSNGTFTVANSAGVTASGQGGTAVTVVEVDNVNPTGCDVSGLGVPGGTPGGARFRLFAASSPDNKRMYVANCDQGSTTVIRTVAESSAGVVFPADTPVLNIPAPPSAFPPFVVGEQPPPQNPVFLLPSS